MSYQTMTIGASPCEESCAQVGHPGYEARSRRECLVFRRMLERLFPLADDVPARFAVISSPHEFGTYREVCVRYEDTDGQACDHACMVEGNTPAEWDAIARYELIWIERKDQLQRAVLRGDLVQPLLHLQHRRAAAAKGQGGTGPDLLRLRRGGCRVDCPQA